jgi:hypothetical protein
MLAFLSDTAITAARFSALRTNHTALRDFLHRMPKGGDLHVHVSGAAYAESLIAWAAQDGLCLHGADMTFITPPCDPGNSPAVAEAMLDQHIYDQMVNAMSVRGFSPSAAVPSGHDQFFAAFVKFGEETWRRIPEMTADLLKRYDAESVQYAEFMLSFFSGSQRQRLAAAIQGQTDFPAMLEKLKAAGLDRIVADARNQITELTRKIETLRDCGPQRTNPGCKVDYRYIAQISRNNAPEDVFVQTALAAALIRAEPSVVALNFVQPEDNLTARRDYTLHMQMIAFLAKDVPVSLHAGELWLGLVPPEDLTFHIREAVEIAGARRIGHGASLAFERQMTALLADMRRRGVAVEINLTSNDVILGVRGNDHPLPAYLAAGVPVVLSTDDAGVARIDLTNEYFRAARDYALGYEQLKAIARDALAHSFLDPQEKRKQLERFDRSCADFERSVASQRSVLSNLGTWIKATVRGS